MRRVARAGFLLLGLGLGLGLGLVGCKEERVPTCDEVVRHTAEAVQHDPTVDESLKAFFRAPAKVAGQIEQCEHDHPSASWRRCVMAVDSQAGFKHCRDTFGRH